MKNKLKREKEVYQRQWINEESCCETKWIEQNKSKTVSGRWEEKTNKKNNARANLTFKMVDIWPFLELFVFRFKPESGNGNSKLILFFSRPDFKWQGNICGGRVELWKRKSKSNPPVQTKQNVWDRKCLAEWNAGLVAEEIQSWRRKWQRSNEKRTNKMDFCLLAVQFVHLNVKKENSVGKNSFTFRFQRLCHSNFLWFLLLQNFTF